MKKSIQTYYDSVTEDYGCSLNIQCWKIQYLVNIETLLCLSALFKVVMEIFLNQKLLFGINRRN